MQINKIKSIGEVLKNDIGEHDAIFVLDTTATIKYEDFDKHKSKTTIINSLNKITYFDGMIERIIEKSTSFPQTFKMHLIINTTENTHPLEKKFEKEDTKGIILYIMENK